MHSSSCCSCGTCMSSVVAGSGNEHPVNQSMVVSKTREHVIKDNVDLSVADSAKGAAELSDLRVVTSDAEHVGGGENGKCFTSNEIGDDSAPSLGLVGEVSQR